MVEQKSKTCPYNPDHAECSANVRMLMLLVVGKDGTSGFIKQFADFKTLMIRGISALIIIAVGILTFQAVAPWRYAERDAQIEQGMGAQRTEARVVKLEIVVKEIQDEATAQNKISIQNQDLIAEQLAKIIAEQIRANINLDRKARD